MVSAIGKIPLTAYALNVEQKNNTKAQTLQTSSNL